MYFKHKNVVGNIAVGGEQASMKEPMIEGVQEQGQMVEQCGDEMGVMAGTSPPYLGMLHYLFLCTSIVDNSNNSTEQFVRHTCACMVVGMVMWSGWYSYVDVSLVGVELTHVHYMYVYVDTIQYMPMSIVLSQLAIGVIYCSFSACNAIGSELCVFQCAMMKLLYRSNHSEGRVQVCCNNEQNKLDDMVVHGALLNLNCIGDFLMCTRWPCTFKVSSSQIPVLWFFARHAQEAFCWIMRLEYKTDFILRMLM